MFYKRIQVRRFSIIMKQKLNCRQTRKSMCFYIWIKRDRQSLRRNCPMFRWMCMGGQRLARYFTDLEHLSILEPVKICSYLPMTSRSLKMFGLKRKICCMSHLGEIKKVACSLFRQQKVFLQENSN